MIKVTKYDGKEIVINAELIETIESTPDTVISLTTKNKIIVKETVEQLIEKIIAYKQLVHKFPQKGESTN